MTRSTDRITHGAKQEAHEESPPAVGSNAVEEATGPRYKAIYQELAQGIRSGHYPVMSLLPTEHDLCEQYNASRHTIREAIRMLTEAGMVSRRSGVGTRVETTKAATRFTQRISQLSDLVQYIKNATLRVQKLRMVKATAGVAEALNCQAGDPWLHINAIKTLGGQDTPVAYVDAYVHPDYSAVRVDVGKIRLPLSRLIEDRYSERIREVNQEFSATPISASIAGHLQVEPKSAGLVITRRYYGENGALMLATITTFPHTQMKYSMSLTVDWQA